MSTGGRDSFSGKEPSDLEDPLLSVKKDLWLVFMETKRRRKICEKEYKFNKQNLKGYLKPIALLLVILRFGEGVF